MNNAAMNETAALCHESWYEDYWHTHKRGSAGDVRPADSNSTGGNATWLHLFLWTQLNFALIHPPPLRRPSAAVSLHLANLTSNLWVIDCLIHSLPAAIHNGKTSRVRATVKEHSVTLTKKSS